MSLKASDLKSITVANFITNYTEFRIPWSVERNIKIGMEKNFHASCFAFLFQTWLFHNNLFFRNLLYIVYF